MEETYAVVIRKRSYGTKPRTEEQTNFIQRAINHARYHYENDIQHVIILTEETFSELKELAMLLRVSFEPLLPKSRC
jgi:hypothetical protein